MLEDVLRKWAAYEVTPMEAYTDIFRLGEGFIQKDGEAPGEFKANPIAYYSNEAEWTVDEKGKIKKKGHFRIMFEDTFEKTLSELQEADFAIIGGITYFGRRNLQSHASKMYALIFDLDGVDDERLTNFLSGALIAEAYPVPNYIALSGHGVHLYYVFEEPVALYPYTKLQLKELKYVLTDKVWNRYTSTEKKVQHQGINQGFRVFGGKTKIDGVRVKVFRLNEDPFTLSKLCEYVPEKSRVDEKKLWKESKTTLEQAKKIYPEWYEKVIENNDRTPVFWDIAGKVNGDNRYALYDWWKRQIYAGATFGHRYFAIMCLVIYGVKVQKPLEEVERDALELIPYLTSLNPKEPFTEEDVDKALEVYDDRYRKFPIKDIARVSGIDIEPNKRNGRKRKVHVKIMSSTRDILYPDGEWRNKNGRPKGSGTAAQKVAEYRHEHPEASVTEVARALEISRPTVYKWWNATIPEDVADDTAAEPAERSLDEVMASLGLKPAWDDDDEWDDVNNYSLEEIAATLAMLKDE